MRKPSVRTLLLVATSLVSLACSSGNESEPSNSTTTVATTAEGGSGGSGGGSGGSDGGGGSATAVDAGFFDTTIASSSAGQEGIALRIFHPASDAARYPDGAPVVVDVQGGHTAGAITVADKSKLPDYGAIAVQFLLPGGQSDGFKSGGGYDYRGPDCQQALVDVLRYARGLDADNLGLKLIDRLPFALTSNVGIAAGSNGGNLAIVTLANVEKNAAPNWITFYESPIGDQYVTRELGGGKGSLNPTYSPGSCTTQSCPWPQLGSLLGFAADEPVQIQDPAGGQPVQGKGVFYVDSNQNQQLDEGEFRFDPIAGAVQAGDPAKAIFSQELSALIAANAAKLYGNTPPSWLLPPQDTAAYWGARDGSLWIEQAHDNLPELLVIAVATRVDHGQGQPDHPHVRSQVQGWLDAGHAFVRVNPDAAYSSKLADVDPIQAKLPDNDVGQPLPYPNINPHLIPKQPPIPATTAAILELADRLQSANLSPNLDATLY